MVGTRYGMRKNMQLKLFLAYFLCVGIALFLTFLKKSVGSYRTYLESVFEEPNRKL
jgi:hypothetical protein